MTLRSTSRPILATLLAIVLVVGVTGCGDDEEPEATGAGPTTTSDGGSTGDIDYGGTTGGGTDAAEGTIVAADFSLTDLTVAPGDPIVLKNEGEAPHTATADDGAFDLGEVEGGDTSEPQTAPSEPGDYAFHCEIHPDMKATLTVEG